MFNKYKKLKDIKIVLFDMEGVLLNTEEDRDTERLKFLASSLEKLCNWLNEHNLKAAILTASDDHTMLEIFRTNTSCEILTSSIDKISIVDKLIEKYGIEYENIFYIGDDILDIPLLRKVGFSAAPNNSRREVKRIVDYISPAESGEALLDDIGSLFAKILSK